MTAKADRQAREAAALRANLLKRKEQARWREAEQRTEDGDAADDVSGVAGGVERVRDV